MALLAKVSFILASSLSFMMSPQAGYVRRIRDGSRPGFRPPEVGARSPLRFTRTLEQATLAAAERARCAGARRAGRRSSAWSLSLIHISEPTRLRRISYA